ncbi:MAG TPA: patatin-like phospholipase family protein [Pyrinomonadaceae bacterium]|jgi:hypothetical protein|nr:patatin-like phospholipase family protein [Pyrinomonadaceae bacterium]
MSTPEADNPLPLYQVLEEEYERLNDAPPPSRLRPDASVKSKDRLADIFNDIHTNPRQHSALCLSGGGIRSATFGLGVLQGLARRGLLDQFSYLSTVSGGGYVGGWLSAWIHRHPRGVTGVMEDLREPPANKLLPEPEPVRHLRSYSNYLTPRLGALSADTWTMVAIVVRNLVLNWLVIVPLMLVALSVPRLALAAAQLDFAASTWMLRLALGVAFVGGVTCVSYIGIKRPSLARVYNTWQGFLFWCLTPLLASAIAATTFWVWYRQHGVDVKTQLEHDLAALLPRWLSFIPVHYSVPFLIFALALHLTGWVIYSAYHGYFSVWQRGWRDRVNKYRFLEFGAIVLSGLVGGVLLCLVAAKGFHDPDMHYRSFVTFSAPTFLALFLLGVIMFAGLSSEYTLDEDREWWARFGGWVLIAMLGWSAASLLVLIGPELLLALREEYVVPAGGVVGLLTAYAARSAQAPPAAKDEKKGGLKAALMRYALSLGALVFTAMLIILFSILTTYLLAVFTAVLASLFAAPGGGTRPSGRWWLLRAGDRFVEDVGELGLDPNMHKQAVIGAPLFLLAAFFVVILLLGLYLSRRINTNKFSYHAMYRNRLIRAYLGASNRERDENPFTGFDPHDNISMHELRPEMFHPGSFRDLGKFVYKLQTSQDFFYKEFRARMSGETEKQIAAYDPSEKPRKVLLRTLVADLNERFVYKAEPLIDDFGDLGLDLLPEAARDIYFKYHPDQPRDGHKLKRPMNVMRPDDLVRFNRWFIQAAFPGDFRDYYPEMRRPFHVINMALNLVRGTNLAWQDRKAESFTVSPLHCGSCQIPDYEDEEDESGKKPKVFGSYRRSRFYGGKDSGGISLGTAVAVSGAAVSPNMGYYSSPLVTFLMTLFNVRLGWWLGNPGKAGAGVYQLSNPKSSALPIIEEALGLTDDENPYVYLSDGGHFENLGLYEMVLRRCNTIVVSDASDDFDFKLDNLGNAIRKIRIDFGIPIEFETMYIYPRSKGHGGAFCAIGTIEYSRMDKVRGGGGGRAETPAPDGKLIYIKPVFYGNEPRDVYHYAQANETFPHESTADQWFSEEQFESYRSLGMYIVGRVVGDKDDPDSINAPTLTMEEFREIAINHDARYKTKARSAEARLAVEQMNKLIVAAAASLEQGAAGPNGAAYQSPTQTGSV